jgi:hypothetical protein
VPFVRRQLRTSSEARVPRRASTASARTRGCESTRGSLRMSAAC